MIQCPHCNNVLYRDGDEDCMLEAVQAANATLRALQDHLKKVEKATTVVTTGTIQIWNMLDEARQAAQNARTALDEIKTRRAQAQGG